ncbi:hypothetical protein K402DRAFT_394471 [Aulographum hederae CBS 113979]|uniref:Uncharacterized protein n=1 Tax=Aulographum hederae CBS 113979 TaxID=1176131 RepID=A0A6G1GY37_9PEZI|nr:hypothetical protein K402DRAFT_394471 [Aulographum hederae CBS 113979]
MDDSTTGAASVALGTLIGYFGAEAASDDIFDHILWPERYWNGFSPAFALPIALLMPMGGPMHKAMLKTLDRLAAHGLFRGPAQGHMLGTAFYPDSGISYNLHRDGEVQRKSCRNCLWIGAVGRMPIPEIGPKAKGTECATSASSRVLRSRTALSILTLSRGGKTESSTSQRVPIDVGAVRWRTFAALACSELSAVVFSIIAAGVGRSLLSCIWLLPLVLKLISAVFSMEREGLQSTAASEEEGSCIAEIRLPNHGALLIQGSDTLVMQFFRHYGHPKRNRGREILQMGIVVGFGLLFPLGLVLSLSCMSSTMRYLWFGYQLYATLVMHICRYCQCRTWCTAEQRITRLFSDGHGGPIANCLELRDGTGSSVLARLSTTYYDRQAEGEEAMRQVLLRVSPSAA